MERRKLATLVFCDVAGSTALGHRTDPEAVRDLMLSYFADASEVLESHGGTVEKFIGDAVVAAFGVPVVHEDDALRACRAALEIQSRLASRIALRIGVNTGEVVASDPSAREPFVTGDAVNVAARLEQAATPGDVLIGESTYQLVRDAVDVEAVEPLTLKGKPEPEPAFRLLAVGESETRPGTPFIGRATELGLLEREFDAAIGDRRCVLVTVVGDPGVGKSRLTAELIQRVRGRARVVRGSCLSYGAGITYWAVGQIVRELAGIRQTYSAEQVRTRLAGLCEPVADGAAVAAQIANVLGVADTATTPAELVWALRRFLAASAREEPLMVVVEDIHWAETALLELLGQLPARLDDAPVLLVCTARPELLDSDPAWPVTVPLERLASPDLESLLESLETPAMARERIAQTAAGNPLFAEELVAWVAGGGDLAQMPAGLNALLGARLDTLEATARDALERAAVEGDVFHYDAVVELSDEASRQFVPAGLHELSRQEMISATRGTFASDLLAYRFKHLLMRDAAYAATSKRLRASLHERLAGWVARRAGDRLVEYEEIVGYHLEQAHIYGAELGHADADLAARAAARLGSAGRRALWRGDERAAANLLERALTLTRPHTLDVMLELDLSQALWADPARAMAVADVAAERAAAAGDETGAALARAVATLHGVQCGICSLDELEVRVQTALPLVQEDGDHAALATIFWLVGPTVANSRGRYEEWATAAEQGLEHARLAGQQRSNLFRIASALMAGPRPADEALHALEVAAVDTRVWTCLRRAELLAMLDRFDEAWIAAEQARELFREQGGEWGEYALAAVATIAGDSAAACEHLQITCDWLETTRQYAFLGSQASMLGLELCRLGRYDEAEARALQTRELSDPEDFMSQALWRQVQSLVVSHRGDHIAAEQLAREALEYVERTDGLAYQGAALTNLAEVLLAAGRTEEAVDSLTQALERYERKRNIALARRVRERLDTLQPVRK